MLATVLMVVSILLILVTLQVESFRVICAVQLKFLAAKNAAGVTIEARWVKCCSNSGPLWYSGRVGDCDKSVVGSFY